MHNFLVLLAFTGVLFFASCNTSGKQNSETTTEETELPVEDNSQTSLDWEGTYAGVLPCADCEGIKTTLLLNQDLSYTLTETYLGTENGDKTFTYNGKFEWDKSGSNITIMEGERKQQYKVGENKVFHLDSAGNVITGDLAEMYILIKT